MNFRDLTIQQIFIVTIGLLMGLGFAFGGIASYSGMNSGSSSNNQDKFNATLPGKNFQTSSFGLTNREQKELSARNDVVFVNAFYNSSEGRQKLSYLQSLTRGFDGRVYTSVVNASGSSSLAILYGINDYPSVVVIGFNRNYNPRAYSDVSQENVKKAICSAFINLGQQSAQCVL
ncbi:MAG: hypothetical protein ABEJ72_05785 [Candidatus Aenigmatarchaeota archaeon]